MVIQMSEYIFEMGDALYNEETGEAIFKPKVVGELVRCKDCMFYVPEDDSRCDVIEQFDVPEMFFCGNGVRGEAE